MTGSPAKSQPQFRPCLTLRTLTRGDGLLGMKPSGPFGPRGGQVTVVQITWAYFHGSDLLWEAPAPTGLLNRRPPSEQLVEDLLGNPLMRDFDAEADALDRVLDTGLHPLFAENLQWRSEEAAAHFDHLWTLVQEDFFGDFWAECFPPLQAAGWRIVVAPGFAHESVTVDAWHLIVNPASGEVIGKQPAGIIPDRAPALTGLGLPADEGSWMLSLGIEIDGEQLDLVPMLAHLLKTDARWRDAEKVAAIDDEALIRLRAPGGRRVDAPAAPLKAIVGTMLELLSDSLRQEGPLPLSSWDAYRLDALRQELMDSQRQRAGPHGAWQLQGTAGLHSLAHRLQKAGEPQPVAAPAGLGVTLRPYQLYGVAWLQYLREHQLAGILADDMGLGKTAQALAHLLIEQHAGRLDLPVLVVLPTSLIFNWQAEARRMAPSLRVLTLQGPDRKPLFSQMGAHDLVLTTYPLLWRDRTALQLQAFHMLILDEAQTVKNSAGRSAGAVRRLQARHRLCLTGTPLENHLGELWAQFDFLMPGFLGDARTFARLWRKPIEIGGETLRAQLLARRVRPFILRRRKDDVAAELPPRTDVVKHLQLRGHQRDLYESVRVASDEQVRRVLKRKGFDGGQITILDALLKLRQVCCDPYLLKGMTLAPDMERAKIEMLRDMLPALVAAGRRILVFSQFTELLDMIAVELADLALPWLALTGKTPPSKRAALIAQFQSETVPIFLVSLKAGGVGLNLTAADTVIHMDPWWNPAVEEQATARAHRIGQDKNVFVYKLVVEGSIEERMLTLQARKAALAQGVLGNDGAIAAKFSAEDLQALLAPLPSYVR
jgi:superfamily II DNA or RNA helicase